MNDEVAKPSSEENFNLTRQPITVDEFIAQFENIESGKLYNLPYYPTDEQAQALAKLKIEITVMELTDGEVLIVKGNNKAQTSLTRGVLLELKPVRKAHTHPIQQANPDGIKRLAEKAGINYEDIDQNLVARIGIIMPSPDDLVLGSVGANSYEIWNEWGKTTYQTYQADDDAFISFGYQMVGNAYTSKPFLSAILDKNIPIEDKIPKMNEVLRALGISFEFKPWE